MAVITFTTPTKQNDGRSWLVRRGTAQATTGQTDWIRVPSGALGAKVDFNLTSVGASTTPTADLTINSLSPALVAAGDAGLDDTYIYKLRGHTAFTTITAAAHLVVDIGPGVTGIADDSTTAATGYSDATINCLLPSVLGLKLVFDRGSGDEVYTYTLAVTYHMNRVV